MDLLSLFFGIVGLVSFGFSIYTYTKTESKKSIEAAKAAMQKERYRNIRYSLLGIYHSADAIVQIPKQGKMSVQQLQHLARVVRAQILVLTKLVELEQKRLEEWQYGKLIESDSGINIDELQKGEVNDKKSDE